MALEVGNGYPERLRARLVPDDTSASLNGFVRDVVEPGSVVITDGFQSYRALPATGYTHRRIVEGSGDAFTNPVHTSTRPSATSRRGSTGPIAG